MRRSVDPFRLNLAIDGRQLNSSSVLLVSIVYNMRSFLFFERISAAA